jgi:hypothetical protein
MTLGTAMPSVFDAGLPTLSYDLTESPHDVYPRIRAAQAVAPISRHAIILTARPCRFRAVYPAQQSDHRQTPS